MKRVFMIGACLLAFGGPIYMADPNKAAVPAMAERSVGDGTITEEVTGCPSIQARDKVLTLGVVEGDVRAGMRYAEDAGCVTFRAGERVHWMNSTYDNADTQVRRPGEYRGYWINSSFYRRST